MRTENSDFLSQEDRVSRFRQLFDRLCAGDEEACETMVREYGAVIRREARMRLGQAYSSFLDTDDVVQSVLRSFLRRAADGKFQLREPAQLVRLLTQMARFKSFTALRREGLRKSMIRDDECVDVVDGRPATDEVVAWRELIEMYRERMNADDWQILQWRLDGHTWPEIASRTDESPDALRKRLSRSLEYIRSTVSPE